MLYRQHVPPAWLVPHVRCFWTLERDVTDPGASPAERVFPDGGMELVFHREAAFEIEAAEGRFERQPASFVFGQIRRAIVLRPPGRVRSIGVSFRPAGAFPFLGAGAASLAGRAVALGDLWGRAGRELEQRVLEARSDDEALAAISDGLRRRFDARRTDGTWIDACVERIERSAGLLPMGRLAHEAGVGERRLERAFAERVGLSPKTLARIVRFQGAFVHAREGTGATLCDVAHAAGYFDQSHFTRDFRRLTGLAPTSVFGEPPGLAHAFAARDGVGFVQDRVGRRA